MTLRAHAVGLTLALVLPACQKAGGTVSSSASASVSSASSRASARDPASVDAAAGNACRGTGQARHDRAKPCPPATALPSVATVEIGYEASYSGTLPVCAMPNPAGKGFRLSFRVERVEARGGSSIEQEFAVHGGTELDSVACGIVVSFRVPRSLGSGIGLKPGDRLVLAQRASEISDGDVRMTHVVARESGEKLFVRVEGARDDSLDTDLLAGLALHVDAEPICKGFEARFSLATGGEACNLESRTEHCCALWGKKYQVQSQAAVLARDPKTPVQVNFVIQAPDFLTRP